MKNSRVQSADNSEPMDAKPERGGGWLPGIWTQARTSVRFLYFVANEWLIDQPLQQAARKRVKMVKYPMMGS